MGNKNNKIVVIIYLLTILYVVNLLVNYFDIIAISLGIILILTILYWVIRFVLERRKIRKIQESDVISIPSQTLYGIPMKVEKHEYETDEGKIKSRWIVESLRPELNNNNLSFVPMNYKLEKVKVPRSEPSQDINYQTSKQISSLTKEIFHEIDPQLRKFREQDAELERLEKLVSSSEIYRSKTHLYKRARKQIQQLIDQAEILKREYAKCIREILIGAEISQFDPNSMSDILERKLTLHSKYEAFKNDFQKKKDEIDAYNKLNIEASQFL